MDIEFPPVPINESKEKKYEKLWSKIRDLIRSITKNLQDYDEDCIKTKFNSDGELPLNKTIEVSSRTIFVAIFLEILSTSFLRWTSVQNIKMESKNELKEINIKNRTCYYFSGDILSDKKSYKAYKNI